MKVFITGATSGIGNALARQYASTGATLGLTGRREAELAKLETGLGVPCRTYAVDVGDALQMKLAAQDFIARHGLPDIVIANAGISVGTLGGDEAAVATLDRVMRTNVIGLAATLTPFVEPMKQAKAGRLVGIASVAGVRGLPGSGAYSSSKAAAMTWLESLRVELRGTGVTVTTICPGWIDTAMTRVNAYRMPFMLPAEEFARRAAHVIEARRRAVVIPWQMGVAAWFMRRMPPAVYDALFSRMPHKRRDLPL
jgi:short-subunit dehydrogenase